MVRTSDYTELKTDVLVIGGGAAATEAAIQAHDAKVDIILVDKKNYGRSGDSGQHPSGNHSASYLGIEGDNVEVNLRDAVEAGKWMVNQKLAEALCQGFNEDRMFLRMENYGSLETRTADGNLVLIYSINKRRTTSGYRLFTHAYEVFKRDIQIFEHTMVTSLLIDRDKVIGATGIDLHTGQVYVFKAKSTVLATGGVGLAINGSLVNERTGDGHAIAYHAGAEFWNMEFRAMPMGCIYPTGLSRVPYVMRGTMTPLDRDGVAFLKDLPQARDAAGSGLYRGVKEVEKIIAQGKGSPCGGTYSTQPQTDMIIPAVHLMARQGFVTNKLEYYWTTVYDYGGLVINEKAETTVPGLYACGEIATNTGAGYSPIRMFSHCITTGRWAGENAARRAKEVPKPQIQQKQIEQVNQRVYDILNRTPSNQIPVHEARQQIQQTAMKGCGPWRSEKKATEALEEFKRIRREVLPRMYVRDKSPVCNMEWKEALEAVNMVVSAEMVTRSALTRTESRGPHIREEYPYMDNDNWLKNIYIRQVDGKMTITTRPIITTKVEAPSGKIWL